MLVVLGEVVAGVLADRGLTAAAGCMLGVSETGVELVSEARTASFTGVTAGDVPAVAEKLAGMGLLAHAAAVGGSGPQPRSELAGVCGPGRAGLAVAVGCALHLPAGLADGERAAAVTAFLGCQPVQDATRLLSRVLAGSWRLVAVSPSAGLAGFLDAVPPPPDEPAIAFPCADGYAWQTPGSPGLTGPFRPALSLVSRSAGTSPPVWAAACEVAPGLAGLDLEDRTWAGAASDDRADAELRAVAEAYERHAAGRIPGGDLITATMNDLGPAAADPRHVIAYRPWQYDLFPGLARFDPAEPRLWARAATPSGQPRWVLADLVFCPFAAPGIQVHAPANSSGMAAHATPAAAARNAWHELLERDAFLRRWYVRSGPPQVTPDTPIPGAALFTADLARHGWAVTLLALGPPGQPIIGVAARNGTQLRFAAAAAPTAQAAAAKAIRETWQAVTASPGQTALPPGQVRGPEDHGRLCLDGADPDVAAFFLTGTTRVRLSQLDRPLPAPGPGTLTYHWPPAITAPFHVARVIDPRLIPITFGYGHDPLGRPDIERMTRQAGLDPDQPLHPHPFP